MNSPFQGVTVAVPVYNSEGSLRQLVQRLASVLPLLAVDFEVILVNDGSKDRSWLQIIELSHEYPFVRGICLMRNYGQHNALLCAIRGARHEVIVTIDDDLQHPPEVLPELLARLTKEIDVVYGPPLHEQHGLFRDIASVVTKLCLQRIMGAETARMVCALRVFRTSLRDAFSDYRSPTVNIDVLLTWGTTRFATQRVRHEARTIGSSNYTARHLLRHAVNMMTGFSVLPLKLASFVGFLFTLFGVAVLAYVVIRFLIQGTPVQGFPFLASIIALFSGAQLFSLGIMGEYLARIHMRMTDRPTFVVQEQSPLDK